MPEIRLEELDTFTAPVPDFVATVAFFAFDAILFTALVPAFTLEAVGAAPEIASTPLFVALVVPVFVDAAAPEDPLVLADEDRTETLLLLRLFFFDDLEELPDLPPLLHCFIVTDTSALVHVPPMLISTSLTVASVNMSLQDTSFFFPM